MIGLLALDGLGLIVRTVPSHSSLSVLCKHMARCRKGLLGLEGALPAARSKLCRTHDLPRQHRDALEAALFKRAQTLPNLPPALVFHDLTPFQSYGRLRADPQFGRSKLKRNVCPLMARALPRDGPMFPTGARSCRGGTLADAVRLEELPNEPGPRPTW